MCISMYVVYYTSYNTQLYNTQLYNTQLYNTQLYKLYTGVHIICYLCEVIVFNNVPG